MFKIIKTLIIALVIISCKNENNNSSEEIKIIDVSSFHEEMIKVNLSEIATKIEYVSLETTSGSLIGQIKDLKRDVLFGNNKIIIRDNSNKLLLFDNNGKFLNKIGNIGRGPGEYVRPQDFTYIKESNSVAIYSPGVQKTLLYSLDGEFIKDFKTDFGPIGLYSYKNDLLFLNPLGRREMTDYYNMSVISTDRNYKKSLFFKSEEYDSKKDYVLRGHTESIYTINDRLHYFENSSYSTDTVWEISNDYNTLIPKYVLDFGGNKTPLDLYTRANFKKSKKRDEFDHIRFFQETSKYMFFEFHYGKKRRLYNTFYDKRTQNMTSLKFKSDYGNRSYFGFNNDLDGGLPFWPIEHVSEDKMFMLVYGYQLKDYVDRSGTDFTAIDTKNREDLLKLVAGSTVNDNPILVIVTLKK